MVSSRAFDVRRLGVVSYGDGLELQRQLVAQRLAGEIPDTLLLLQHPHVLTLGVKAGQSRQHVLEAGT
jgi:lipoyl(octanoyl) transferase